MKNKIDAAPYFWRNFHKRGVLSHLHRAKALRHIPMPKCGGPKAWTACATAQNRICADPRYLYAVMGVTSEHLTALTKADPKDQEWWEANAPAGCVSPLGTFAAVDALRVVHEVSEAEGYVRGITIPFLLASLRELFCLLLMLSFYTVIPIAYPVVNMIRGTESGLVMTFALSFISFSAGRFAKEEYRKQL